MASEGTTLTSSARTEMFSDGVFAIAATLLVIDVAVPLTEEPNLLHLLLDQWASYAAYAVSFMVIGIMWVNHHGTLERVAKVNRQFLFLNLALLGCVAFIPFPTALLAEYLKEGGVNARWAAFTYALVLMLASLAFTMIWVYLGRNRGLLSEDCEPHAPRVAVQRGTAGTITYAVTAGVALLSAYVASFIFLAIAVSFIFAEHDRRSLSD